MFLTYEWIRSWWDGFGEKTDATLYVLAAWAGDELVGIAPLLRERRHVFGRPRPIVSFCANDYSNRINLVVARERVDEVLRAFVAHLAKNRRDWDVVQLGPMVRESPVTEALLRVLEGGAIRHGVSGSYQSPFLALPRTMDQVVEGLSPSFRKTLRRKLNKAGKLASLRVVDTCSPERLADAIEIDRHTWQHANGTGIGSTEPIKTFYAKLAQRTAESGWLRLAFVVRDERPVCFEYNLLYKNVLYNLKLGYLPEQGDWSPGIFLKHHVLTGLVEAGASEYDFLGSDEPYKLHWTSTVRPHCYVWLLGRSWDARLAGFLLLRVRPWLRDRAPWLNHLRGAAGLLRGRRGPRSAGGS